jgi:transcriptional regulator with XRE-family HTH domain
LPFCHRTLIGTIPRPGYPKQFKYLGDHIRARRLNLGLRQMDVAMRIGAQKDTIRNWEMGRTEPEVRFIPAVMQFLGYDPISTPYTSGQDIRGSRLRLGLSQKRLAALAGVDEGSVRRAESDTKRMAHRVQQAVRRY